MRHRIGHGLVLAGASLLAVSIATGVQAQCVVTAGSHGVRQENCTVGPVHAQEDVGGRSGTGTWYYTFSYVNARDYVDLILQTAGMPLTEPDVTNLVADVKSGQASFGQLSDMFLGPHDVGDNSSVSGLPAGFHGHNSSTWDAMGFYNSDWSARYTDASNAMHACNNEGSMADAQSCIQQQISNGDLVSWNFEDIFNTIGWDFSFSTMTSPEDTYLKGIMGDIAPHFVGVVLQNPGSSLQYLYHSYDERGDASGDGPQAYVAVSYFLSQAQRWINTYRTLQNLGAGNLANTALDFARDDAGILTQSGDPLVLDLDHKGFIEVTGKSSAILRAPKNMGFQSAGSVLFDLYGAGPRRMEWVRGGEGFLVDAKDVKEAMAQGRPLTGRDLMGDAEGRPGGFAKLADYDHQHAGKIVGKDLDQLAVWVDKNHNGRAEPGEIYSMKQLGITEIDYKAHYAYDKDHEPLEVAGFVQHGKRYKVQEVWFAFEPQHLASRGGN